MRRLLPIAALAVAVAAAAGVWWWMSRPGPAPVLGVLPFANNSAETDAPLAPARRARRDAAASALDGGSLRRLSEQPLQAVRPQQPLDIGLFEVRAPEAPDLILPDE